MMLTTPCQRRETMTDDEMLKALANYHGPVKRCEPGQARGKRVKPLPLTRDKPVNVQHERKTLKDDEVAGWLCEHDPEIAAERRREKRERAERAAGTGESGNPER
jgi:hypothetical protein